MASFVKSTGIATRNGFTTLVLTFGTAPAATTNTVVIKFAVNDTTLTASAITDNQGSSGWVVDKTDNDGTGIGVYIARKNAALSTGSALVVTVTSSASVFWSGEASEYSSVGATVTTGTSGGGTTQPFSATTAASLNSGDLVVSAVMANGNVNPQGISDPPTGGTGTWVTRGVNQDTTTGTGFVAADQLNGTGGTETATTAVTGVPFASRIGIIVGYVSAAAAATTGGRRKQLIHPGRHPDKFGRHLRTPRNTQSTTAVTVITAGVGTYTWVGTSATIGQVIPTGKPRATIRPGNRGPFNVGRFYRSPRNTAQTTVALNATPGTYSWAGTTATTNQLVNAGVGAWTWAGTTAATSQLVNAGVGSYTWAGTTATTSQLIAATAGAYTWAGTTAGTTQLVNAGVGAYAWAGTTASFGSAIQATPGTWSWAGTTAEIPTQIGATVGGYSWAGTDATIPQAGGGGGGKPRKRYQIKLGNQILEGSKAEVEALARDIAIREARDAAVPPVVEVLVPGKKRKPAITASTQVAADVAAVYRKALAETVENEDDEEALIALLT